MQPVLNEIVTVSFALRNTVSSCFGPGGNLKLIAQKDDSNLVVCTKNGNEILRNIFVSHPVGSIISKVVFSQFSSSGDGTCTVVMLIGELMKSAEILINKNGLHPIDIVDSYLEALSIATTQLQSLRINILENELPPISSPTYFEDTMKMPAKFNKEIATKLCASVLSTKILGKSHLVSDLSLLCVETLDFMIGSKTIKDLMKNRINILRDISIVSLVGKEGGTFFKGIIIPQLFSGEEIEDIIIKQPNIMVINCVVKLTLSAVEKLKQIGCNVLISTQPFSEEEIHYFQKSSIFFLSNVSLDLVRRVCLGLRVQVIQSAHFLYNTILKDNDQTQNELFIAKAQKIDVFYSFGNRFVCVHFGEDREVIGGMVTLLIRSPDIQTLKIMHSAVYTSLFVLCTAIEDGFVLPGCGVPEISCAQSIRSTRTTNKAKKRIYYSFAKSLESIVGTLGHNSGFHSIDVIDAMKEAYENSNGTLEYGLKLDNLANEHTIETTSPVHLGVYDSYRAKMQSFTQAVEVVSILLKIDQIVKANFDFNPEQNIAPQRGEENEVEIGDSYEESENSENNNNSSTQPQDIETFLPSSHRKLRPEKISSVQYKTNDEKERESRRRGL
eukprot:TRINITY_DN5254_c0_g1_i1.p1 TRINITY_DN5254_c0_g1~~TRINITY_DN5254_c0_g1_i1.p1  ORF type:complete len:612 (+),score=110.70 TRINITY_DN5254_c0_g1_i1:304-2139(+)